jgi:hypothetical protein
MTSLFEWFSFAHLITSTRKEANHEFLTPVLLILGLLATAVTRAQEPKPASKTLSEQDVDTLKIDTNLVTVPVIASTRTGGYIADLKKEEFKLTKTESPRRLLFSLQ